MLYTYNELSPSAYRIIAMPTGAQVHRFQISQEQVFLFHGVMYQISLGHQECNMVSETHQTLTGHQLRAIISY